MAARGNQVYTEKFCCSLCLELLKDPVTPTCGHSYCRSCIKDHWDSEQARGLYSCPQCRETFTPRPDLRRNIMLAETLEELKKTELQAAAAEHYAAGPDDVACDFCTGRKRKAQKSCLSCLASYCENHLQPHFDLAPLKKHKLVEPCQELQETICPQHCEVMKMFCRTDRQCICYLCSVDQHKGHDVVSAAAERNEKQKELEKTRLKIQQRVKDTEGDVKLLQQEAQAVTGSADRALEESEELVTELINDLLMRSLEVTQKIRSRQEAEERRLKELQEELEQEIAELKRRDAQLEQLAQTQDHNKFLQDYASAPTLGPATRPSTTRTRPLTLFENLMAALSQVRGQIQDFLTRDSTNISQAVDPWDVLLTPPEPEPERRADFLKYSQEIKLDPNTANKRLMLSDGNRKVTCVIQGQSYPHHPDRFTDLDQVLSRESLTGRCYWEVEWRGPGVGVAVSYKNISRAGRSEECWFGYNDKSWMLLCSGNNCYFYHNKSHSPVPGPVSTRVGVYLDHSAGVLSFYSVSDTRTLIHRVRTTFTGPLHAGVGVNYPGSSAEFCQPK